MLQIPLPPDTEETLRERAKANGEDVSSYAARLIQEALNTPSVDELLAPFRKQVEESGISDEALDQFGEELRREVRQEKQALKAKTAPSGRDCLKVTEQQLLKQGWADAAAITGYQQEAASKVEEVVTTAQREPTPDPYTEKGSALATEQHLEGRDVYEGGPADI